MNGVLRRISVLLCLVLFVGVVPAGAQVSTGEINGKVVDGTGAVLPGVSVTIAGAALIQPQTTVTAESGAYRFPSIPIGTYTVTFELAGFKKLVRDGVIITAGFNAQIDGKLELSTVQETVTVTGESPVVDTKSTTLSASFNREALQKIPNARDPWVIIEQTPGMIMSGTNVGGNLSGQQTSFNAMGSGSNQQWNINGAVISDIASGNSSPTYYDFDSFEEIQITTAGADASQQGAGVQVNFITKSGSNKFTGYGRFFDTNDKCFGQWAHCQGQNVTTALRQQGAQGGNPIQNIRDMGAQLGGPIKRNKAWFWGAMSRQDTRVGVLGFFNATSGCASIAAGPNTKAADGSYVNSIRSISDCLFGDLTTLKNDNARLQYQESSAHQTEFSYTYGAKDRTTRGCDAFHPLITCTKQTGPTVFYTTQHRWIASNRMSIIAQYTHIHEDWFLGFEDPALKDVQPINWVDTTYWDRSLGSRTGAYHTIRPQDDVRADVNYFLSNKLGADHSLKFGFAVRRSPVESINTVPGGAQARYRGIYDFVPGQYITTPSDPTGKRSCTISGVAYTANTVNGCDEANIIRDSDFTYTLYQRDLYINDSIRKDRATINLGLRYDHQHDIATPGTVPANRLLPAQLPAISFPGADSKARYNNWSPMAGITYDLTGNGKTILKASARRYWGLGMYTASNLEPTGSTTTLRFPWKDLNGDKTVQTNELQIFKADGTLNLLNSPAGYDANNPSSITTLSLVDPNLKNDITDEAIVGIDREVMNNFGVGAMYIYRKYHQFFDNVRYLDHSSDWSGPIAFTAACGNALCSQSSFTESYFQRATNVHPNTIQENNTAYRVYSGLQFTARKRLSNRWSMTGSYVLNNVKAYYPTPDLDYTSACPSSLPCGDPTNYSPTNFFNGYEDGTRNGKHVFKLNGLYVLPWDITVGANLLVHTSFPFNPTITLTSARTGTADNPVLRIVPSNSIHYPTVKTFDLDFNKAIRLGGSRRVTLDAAIFNIGNANTVLAQTTRQNTSTANFITTIVAPTVMRFGIKVDF